MLTLLQTNDFHGRLSAANAEQIAALKDPNSLYFDCGDVIRAGNLAIPLAPEAAWPLLHRAGCDASVLGNRESHILESALQKKIQGVSHPILVANMVDKSGRHRFETHRIFSVAGFKVGVFGVMVPMVTTKMKTVAASAFVWEQPIPTAIDIAKQLREECDMVIALTHIGLRQDRELAAATNDIDIILGGHSHDLLTQPEVVGKTAICQTGSHGKFVGRYQWDGSLVASELIPLHEA